VWVPLEYFRDILPSLLERPINYVSWYTIVDDQSLRFNNSLNYTHEMIRLDTTLRAMLPNIKIDYSPVDELKAYDTRLNSLMTLVNVIGAPLVLLALIFISLTASIAIQQEEQEITTLRGRGVSHAQVYVLNLAESLVLIFFAIPFALLLGWLAANLMGHTQLFLQFNRISEFVFSLNDINLVWIGVLCLVIVVARLAPLIGLRHTTAVTIKQEKSRGSKKPLWERFFLDFLFLFLAGYAFWTLKGQAKPLNIFSEMKISGGTGQYDPLMFLASSLFAVAACMIALRIFPILMRILAAISNRFFRAGSYLAVQDIARRPQEHASVMLLIMISLSLAIYSATMAKTLDQWMHDSQYYQAGADLVVREYQILQPNRIDTAPTTPTSNSAQRVESLVSLEKHLQVPGIKSATFVGKYKGNILSGSGQNECILMGIDRVTFPETAFFRYDFTSQPLVTLMNALANEPNGVLAPQSLLDRAGLQIGDRVTVTAPVGLIAEGFNAEMVIVGAYSYFPTVYPADIPTLILTMDTLFGGLEAATDYDVWISLQDKTNDQTILEKLKGLAFRDQLFVDVRGNVIQQVRKLMGQPEWVGLFGILSVGFLLTGLMPCIGFVLDTFASLRKNYVQLGILQAIGLTSSQLINYLVLERLLLMGGAMICGAVIGFITSILFVPLLQAAIGSGAPVPPFEVLFGWKESLWLILAFALVLVISVIATIVYLVQVKIFQAVKLGETI
jgi:putative ABC transport system permease protein